MIWGIFPIFPQISWESHMLGSISGFVLAIYYRKQGPQEKIYEWELEDEEDEENP
jgi:membrane associated rhomboid family serine protease